MKINYKKESGYAVLFIVIIVNAAALVIVTSIMIWGFYFHKTSLAQLKSVQARGLADACAEHALQQIRNDENYTGTQNLNIGEGSCSYIVAGISPNKIIQTTGLVDDATRKVLISTDQINPIINLSSWQEVADF